VPNREPATTGTEYRERRRISTPPAGERGSTPIQRICADQEELLFHLCIDPRESARSDESALQTVKVFAACADFGNWERAEMG